MTMAASTMPVRAWVRRMAAQALAASLTGPISGARVRFTAPVPPILRTAGVTDQAWFQLPRAGEACHERKRLARSGDLAEQPESVIPVGTGQEPARPVGASRPPAVKARKPRSPGRGTGRSAARGIL